jgi:hypothetical protein
MQSTILDLCDRDEQDDTLFPIDAPATIFTRKIEPVLNHVITINEHTQRGPGEFGQRFVFDLGRQHGDLIAGLFLQIKLGSTPLPANWFYANSLGTAIIARAELEIDGVIVETIDSDYINIKTLLSSTANSFGFFADGIGHLPVKDLLNWPATRKFPTDGRTLICPLTFHFNKKALLPIISIKEKSVRVNVQLRPFKECIRLRGTEGRASCDVAPPQIALDDLRLLVQSVYIEGALRKSYMSAPFEYLYRQPQTFRFTEPSKYIMTKSAGDSISVQLPLEINGPIEELWWVFRRKSAAVNNEWVNYSLLAEYQIANTSDDLYAEPPAPIKAATIQINGVNVVSAEGNYFREHIAARHPGAYMAYRSFIYGYSFASEPGKHQPSGSFNASRAQSVRLVLEIQTPPSLSFASSTEWSDEVLKGWEIAVYSIGLNWMRIENGMANKLFSN